MFTFSGGFEDDHEITFKEPSIVLSPNSSFSGPNNLSSPESQPHRVQSPVRPPTTSPPTVRSTRPRRGAALATSPVRKSPSPVRRPPSPVVIRKPPSSPVLKHSEPVSKTFPIIPVQDEQNGEIRPSANNSSNGNQQPIIRSYTRTRQQVKPNNFPARNIPPANFPQQQSYEEEPISKKPKQNEDEPEITTKNTSTKDLENSFKKPLENTEIIEKQEVDIAPPPPPSIVKAHSWSASSTTTLSTTTSHVVKKELENNSKLSKAVSISASDASDIMLPPPAMPPSGTTSSSIIRPKKSIFKSKSQNDQKRKGLSLYKHSFGAQKNEDKDEEEIRRKVFQQKAMSMDFDEEDLDDHPKVTDMSFR